MYPCPHMHSHTRTPTPSIPQGDQFGYCPPWALAWPYRKLNLLKELLSYDADVMCLQEVQSNHFQVGGRVAGRGRGPGCPFLWCVSVVCWWVAGRVSLLVWCAGWVARRGRRCLSVVCVGWVAGWDRLRGVQNNRCPVRVRVHAREGALCAQAGQPPSRLRSCPRSCVTPHAAAPPSPAPLPPHPAPAPPPTPPRLLQDFLAPELQKAGYTSIYKKKTTEVCVCVNMCVCCCALLKRRRSPRAALPTPASNLLSSLHHHPETMPLARAPAMPYRPVPYHSCTRATRTPSTAAPPSSSGTALRWSRSTRCGTACTPMADAV